MPTTTTEVAESFTFQGPLVFWQAVVLGVAVIAIVGWTLWNEGRRADTSTTWLFWLLRSVVVSLVLWMLLGPTWQTVRRETTPRSIAIISDVSLSMDTVDAPRGAEDVRWALSSGGRDGDALVAADRATVAARSASDRYQNVLGLLGVGGQLDRLADLVESTESAIARTHRHIMTAASQLRGNPDGLETRAMQLADIGRGDLISDLHDIARQLKSSNPVLSQQQMADLAALGPRIERFAQGTAALADQLAARWSVNLDSETLHDVRNASKQSRHDKVASVLTAAEKSWLLNVADEVRILRYRFGGVIQQTTPDGWTTPRVAAKNTKPPSNQFLSTNLHAALDRISQDAASEMLEAVIVLTDGRHNARPERDPISLATSSLQGLPIYAVPIGSAEAAADVFVHHADAPTAVIENDDVVIEAIVSTYQCANTTGTIKLIADEEVLDQSTIEITSDRSDHRVSFATKATQLGRKSYQLRFEPLPVEANVDNNSVELEVEVIADTIRVLLADNLPRWEFRYLLNLFDRDDRIECDRLLFSPRRYGTGKLSYRSSLPDVVDLWNHYRVVILGDMLPGQLGPRSQATLSEYVRRQGGTLVVIAGKDAMPHEFAGQPLAGLLPVEASGSSLRPRGYVLSLTPAGRFTTSMHLANDESKSERVWREMSETLPLRFLSSYSKPKSSSRVLVRATSRSEGNQDGEDEWAFLSWQDVGRGRVVYLAAPATYQLRFRHGDRYHHRFWGQLIRWAVARELAPGSQTVKLSTDKPRYEYADRVQVVAQLMELDGTPLRTASVEARAKLDGEVVSTIELVADERVVGRYFGSFDALNPATYQIAVGGKEVRRLLREEAFGGDVEVAVVVEPVLSTEISDVRSNRPMLAQLAAVTGGQIIPPTALEEVVRLSPLSPHVKEEVSNSPLWNRWSVLWIIIGCLVVEWILRKRVGLT